METRIRLFNGYFDCSFEFKQKYGKPHPVDEAEIGKIITIDGGNRLLTVFLEMGFENEIRTAILDSYGKC